MVRVQEIHLLQLVVQADLLLIKKHLQFSPASMTDLLAKACKPVSQPCLV
jgi:hypothetical protein